MIPAEHVSSRSGAMSRGGLEPDRFSSCRILFVHNSRTRFVELDRELLASRHEVRELQLTALRIQPIRTVREVLKHDIVFGWFASWHTLFPVLVAWILRKPSILVIGGYDLANLPEIGYGHQRGGIRKHVSSFTMRLATSLVTNSCFSRGEASRNAGVDEDFVTVVYHGLPDAIGPLPAGPRSRTALTVGNVDRVNLKRKGLETFVRAAAHLPDVEFVLAGGWKDDAIEHLRRIATPNVVFAGRVSELELCALYRRAAVYVQVSLHEGFGMSVAEAMLAGCIPVVSNAGALPEVVGDQGIYLSDDEPHSVASAVRSALSCAMESRASARQRILDEFPLERREAALHALIEGLGR